MRRVLYDYRAQSQRLVIVCGHCVCMLFNESLLSDSYVRSLSLCHWMSITQPHYKYSFFLLLLPAIRPNYLYLMFVIRTMECIEQTAKGLEASEKGSILNRFVPFGFFFIFVSLWLILCFALELWLRHFFPLLYVGDKAWKRVKRVVQPFDFWFLTE